MLIYELAKIGHNLTILSLDIPNNPPNNVHFIHLENVYEKINSEYNDLSDQDFLDMGTVNPYQVHVSFGEYEFQVCQLAIQTDGFKMLMNYPNNYKFEVIIHDFLAGPCLLVCLHKFKKAQLISVTAFNGLSTTVSLTGSMIYPSFIPNYVYDITPKMNFIQRLNNFMLSFWELFYREWIYLPKIDKIVKNYYPEVEHVSIYEKMTKIVLINSHPAVEYQEPMWPYTIPVGGKFCVLTVAY